MNNTDKRIFFISTKDEDPRLVNQLIEDSEDRDEYIFIIDKGSFTLPTDLEEQFKQVSKAVCSYIHTNNVPLTPHRDNQTLDAIAYKLMDVVRNCSDAQIFIETSRPWGYEIAANFRRVGLEAYQIVYNPVGCFDLIE